MKRGLMGYLMDDDYKRPSPKKSYKMVATIKKELDKGNEMNFFEAMVQLQLGKKIRIRRWGKGEYIGLKEQGFKFCGIGKIKYSILDERRREHTFSNDYRAEKLMLSDLIEAEWEEFKEE